MSSKIVLLVIAGLSIIGAVLISGLAVAEGIKCGIALGQHACLTSVQHSSNTQLIAKVKERANRTEGNAQVLGIMAVIIAVAGGVSIGFEAGVAMKQ
jgi:hypothetical protein